MAASQKKYKDIKTELDDVLAWFEQDDIDIDKALKKYQLASELIKQLEKLLNEATLEVKKLNK